jgi:hypothetical protein
MCVCKHGRLQFRCSLLTIGPTVFKHTHLGDGALNVLFNDSALRK